MNRYAARSIRAAAAGLFALQAALAHAQAPAEPQPAPAATAPAGRAVPQVPMERAARESAAKADALQKAMDARIRRVTRSICAGCSERAIRPHRRAPRSVEGPSPRDPAQAPED